MTGMAHEKHKREPGNNELRDVSTPTDPNKTTQQLWQAGLSQAAQNVSSETTTLARQQAHNAMHRVHATEKTPTAS